MSNISKLSPLRRGYLMGWRRARFVARAEMRSIAAHWEAEVVALQNDYDAIALELHRDCYERALLQRAND